MIISIQGFNKKKNDATKFAAQFADMLSLTHSNARTILIQLTNNDEDNAEDMLRKDRVVTDLMADNEKTLPILEQSIDGFVSTTTNQRINNDLVANYVKTISAIRGQSNRQIIKSTLDVMPISKNDNFVQNIENNKELLSEILTCLQEERMYNYVIVVCDSKSEELLKNVNELADKSIYCLNQRFSKKSKAYGKDIFYVLPSYEPDSSFTLKAIVNNYGFDKKTKVYTVAANAKVQDACYNGTLHEFIAGNKDIPHQDNNYTWSEDLKTVIDAVIGKSAEIINELEVNHFIKEEYTPVDDFSVELEIPAEEEIDERGFFARLFSRKNKETTEVSYKPNKKVKANKIASEKSDEMFEGQPSSDIELTENELLELGELEKEIDLSVFDIDSVDDTVLNTPKKKGFSLFKKKEEKEVIKQYEDEAYELSLDQPPVEIITNEIEVTEETDTKVTEFVQPKAAIKKVYAGIDDISKNSKKTVFTSIG